MVRPTYFSMGGPTAASNSNKVSGRKKKLKRRNSFGSNASVSSFGSNTTTSTASMLRRAFSLTSLKNLVRKKRPGGTTATASMSFEFEFQEFEDDYPTQSLLSSDSLGFYFNTENTTPVNATAPSGRIEPEEQQQLSQKQPPEQYPGNPFQRQRQQEQPPSEQKPKGNDSPVAAFLELGDAENEEGRYDEALDCWMQALSLSRNTSPLRQSALWKLTMLHLKLATDRTLCVEDAHHDKPYHKREALTYLRQLNLDQVPDAWLEEQCRTPIPREIIMDDEYSVQSEDDDEQDLFSGTTLLEVLMEAQEWSAALRLSDFMADKGCNVDKNHENRTDKIKYEAAVQQGNIPLLEQSRLSTGDSDPFLQRRILFALVRAYFEQGQYEDALNYNAELTLLLQQNKHEDSNDDQKSSEVAKAHYDKAEILSRMANPSDAWDALHHGLGALGPSDKTLYVQLLQLKADILFREGIFEECLKVHQQVYAHYQSARTEDDDDYPLYTDMAKLFYTMGRLSLKTRHFSKAIEYFRRELQVARKALGNDNPEVSRILHDLARLYDEQLGDYDTSMKYYKKAFKVESHLLEQVVEATESCQECFLEEDKASYCQEHSESYKTYYSMICESKKCMGRIHYKTGDFCAAVQTSFANDDNKKGSLLPT